MIPNDPMKMVTVVEKCQTSVLPHTFSAFINSSVNDIVKKSWHVTIEKFHACIFFELNHIHTIQIDCVV